MKTAVLAGVCLPASKRVFDSRMDEMRELCKACGLETAAVITQVSRTADSRTVFRSGKIQELKALCEETGASVVVFYNQLTIQAARRISEATETEVIDRTALILDIFSQRARTKQAKLQTEMARLQYDLPRILEREEGGEHERGGSSVNRGAGEMRSQLIERKYAARIRDLKAELKKIEKQRWQDERRRTRTLMRRAALIGYTNAGKSSLMNAFLARSHGSQPVYEEDMLFATLDTSVRMIRSGSRSFLLYDTVGFVSDLPHELVEAFQSTLDAARDADLLIHVIDASDPEWEEKMQITEETLSQIHAGDIPVLRVYNKCDREISDMVPSENRVSCLSGEGISELMEQTAGMLYPSEDIKTVLVPYDKMSMVDEYKAALLFRKTDESEDGIVFEVSGPKRYLAAFRDMEWKEGKQ